MARMGRGVPVGTLQRMRNVNESLPVAPRSLPLRPRTTRRQALAAVTTGAPTARASLTAGQLPVSRINVPLTRPKALQHPGHLVKLLSEPSANIAGLEGPTERDRLSRRPRLPLRSEVACLNPTSMRSRVFSSTPLRQKTKIDGGVTNTHTPGSFASPAQKFGGKPTDCPDGC